MQGQLSREKNRFCRTHRMAMSRLSCSNKWGNVLILLLDHLAYRQLVCSEKQATTALSTGTCSEHCSALHLQLCLPAWQCQKLAVHTLGELTYVYRYAAMCACRTCCPREFGFIQPVSFASKSCGVSSEWLIHRRGVITSKTKLAW